MHINTGLRFSSTFTLKGNTDFKTMEILKNELGDKPGIKLYPEGMPDGTDSAYTIHTQEPEISDIKIAQYIVNNQSVIKLLFDKLQLPYDKNDTTVLPDSVKMINDTKITSTSALEEFIKNFEQEDNIKHSCMYVSDEGYVTADISTGKKNFKYIETPMDKKMSKIVKIIGDKPEKLTVEFGKEPNNVAPNDIYYVVEYTAPDGKLTSYSSLVKNSDLNNLKQSIHSLPIASLKENNKSANIGYKAFVLAMKIMNKMPEAS